jgi:hypothetical protein
MKRLLLATVALFAAPALALPPLGATVGYAADVVSRRSYDFVAAEDHLPKFAVSAGTRFALERGTLDLDLAFTTGGAGATSHTTLNTELGLITLEAAATFRYAWLRHLEPYARVSAGPGWATLTAYTAGGPVYQTLPNLSATGLVGLSFPFALTAQGTATLVLDFGVGYSLRPVYNFNSLQREPLKHPTGDELPDVPLALGRLDLSGIAYRFGVGMRL